MESSASSNEPLVSVIITTFNRPEILKNRALKSILDQTYQNIECIVVDDPGAKQSAEAVVKAAMANDDRVCYIKTPATGHVNAARNFGIDASRGDYICGIDDDDEWLPTFVEETLRAFEGLGPEFGAVTTGFIMIDEDGRRFYDKQDVAAWWHLAIGCGYLFKRDVFFKGNLRFDENLFSFDDVDLALRFGQSGYRIYLVDRPLRIYNLPSTRPGKGVKKSLSDPSLAQARSFEIFYKKTYEIYAAMGPEALSWIHLSGGLICCRGGLMKQGRHYVWMAFKEQPSFYTFFYAVFSLLPAGVYARAFFLKNRIMRRIRATVLNPIPHENGS